ncbi:MAG: pyridoxamine 5'-phosphate oxidase family protein [Candidatus Aenigmarchaeota archaeon]|nr:pyridoxamine 5'-phosphate oxidase family protein [Candidatus Aenigmarchaeota archaeon]
MGGNTRELTLQAKRVISRILYITLATSGRNCEPWNSPVYSAFDKDYAFYWVSWAGNQHSKNIRENENVFVVIYDSTVPEGTGFGVYMKGKARQLGVRDGAEIVKALKLLYGRTNKKPRSPKEFLKLFPRRVFKFVPDTVWVNGGGTVNGNFVDTRIDITAELLR